MTELWNLSTRSSEKAWRTTQRPKRRREWRTLVSGSVKGTANWFLKHFSQTKHNINKNQRLRPRLKDCWYIVVIFFQSILPTSPLSTNVCVCVKKKKEGVGAGVKHLVFISQTPQTAAEVFQVENKVTSVNSHLQQENHCSFRTENTFEKKNNKKSSFPLNSICHLDENQINEGLHTNKVKVPRVQWLWRDNGQKYKMNQCEQIFFVKNLMLWCFPSYHVILRRKQQMNSGIFDRSQDLCHCRLRWTLPWRLDGIKSKIVYSRLSVQCQGWCKFNLTREYSEYINKC